MRNIWTIAKREFKLYFSTPIAYMVVFIILLILGLIFYVNILAAMAQGYTPGVDMLTGLMVTLFLFSTPAITMRLLAEEQRMGTIELLLTAPVRDYELVVGKWLGGWLFLLTIIAVTMIFPFLLNIMVQPGIDQGPLVTNYLGLMLISAAMVAVGVAVSALFSNQIAAFFTTLGVLLILWWISLPSQVLGATGGSLLSYLDISEHFYPTLYIGVIDLADIVFYLSLTALALFLGTVVVEMRRWR